METKRMGELYQQAATIINQTIPEAWNKVYLYAEVAEDSRTVFFYYYPERQSTPLQSIEIPMNYEGIDEAEYENLELQLYDCFTELWEEFKKNKQAPWTNLTFFLSRSGDFKIEYGYEDLSDQDDFESKVIWMYKHLGFWPQSNYANRIVETYLQRTKEGPST